MRIYHNSYTFITLFVKKKKKIDVCIIYSYLDNGCRDCLTNFIVWIH